MARKKKNDPEWNQLQELFYRAQALMVEGDFDEILEIAQTGLAIWPEFAHLMALQGIAQMKKNQIETGHLTLVRAMFIGIKQNNVPLLQLCLHFLSPDEIDERGVPVLAHAIIHRKPEMVEVLLSSGAKVEACHPKKDNCPSLLLAAEKGSLKMVQLLLDHGADPNTKGPDAYTALMNAACGNYPEIASLLIEKGADVNTKNYWTSTALKVAAARGATGVIKILAESGADMNERDIFDISALDAAIEFLDDSHLRLLTVTELLDSGADPNSADFRGTTPLMRAVEKGDEHVVELLLSKGVDPMKKNEGFNGFYEEITARRMAEDLGFFEIAEKIGKHETTVCCDMRS